MPFDLELDYDRGVPVYRQIVEAVVRALANGRLAADEQLPTIVELAQRLGVNPNTVARAYRDLEHDGHLVAKRGRGTFGAPLRLGTAHSREAILRDIYDRAIQEGAKHAISAREILRFFRKAQQDE